LIQSPIGATRADRQVLCRWPLMHGWEDATALRGEVGGLDEVETTPDASGFLRRHE